MEGKSRGDVAGIGRGALRIDGRCLFVVVVVRTNVIFREAYDRLHVNVRGVGFVVHYDEYNSLPRSF